MSEKPNILLILSDQHNPHIAGFAGDRWARTASLDDLASSGVRFDAAYCQSPLCVPSRISMLTGKLIHRCSAWANGSMLMPEHRTLPEYLADQGYVTVLVGKMHLRGPRFMGGFQHRPYGDLIVDRFCFHQPDPLETWDGRWCSHSVGRFPWAGPSEIPESLLADGIVTRESLAFLLEYVDSGRERPFFLCAGYGRPHFPLTAPSRYVRRALADPPPLPPRPSGYPDTLHPHDRAMVEEFHLREFSDEIQQRALACYYASLHYLDDCIGELLNGIERAGLLDDTLVIYTSDHGDMTGEHGLWCKRTYYDASSRVPLIIAGPRIEGGRVVTEPVELVDLLPTLCQIAGLPVPDGIDGETLLPLLSSQSVGTKREKQIARSALFSSPHLRFRMARDRRWKYVEFPAAPPVLFDMISDPGETNDLLREGPPPVEAPIDVLQQAASCGLDWDEIEAIRQADIARQPEWKPEGIHGPVQYRLANGRIVDADSFLYPGLTEQM